MKPETVLIITGPTGTGKSEFALRCAERFGGEIVNGDAGQFYAPLIIGTASPTHEKEEIPHHLFGHLNSPTPATAYEWYTEVEKTVTACWSRGNLPIIVGGSGFYIGTLLFPLKKAPRESTQSQFSFENSTTEALYKELLKQDALRAKTIHHNDRYRIIRALSLAATGVLPSESKPAYAPFFSRTILVVLDRKDTDLLERIERRVDFMIKSGWKQEVDLLSDSWRFFAQQRGFIGYKNLIDLPIGSCIDYGCFKDIAHETWRYVKRQRKYLRSLKKRVANTGDSRVIWKEWCLTSENHQVYLDQIESICTS
jgi:tRNA dimethylallyltransferase